MIKENIEKNAQTNRDLENGSSNKGSFLKQLLERPVMLPLFISTSLMFFQQWSGVNVVIYYTVYIFNEAESDIIDENLATIVVGITQFLATFGE